MSLYEQFQASKNTSPVVPPSSGGAVPPVTPTPPSTGGGLYAKFQAEKSAPIEQPKPIVTEEKKSLYGKYADQVERKAMSWNAGILESIGGLVRSAQWASDRVVGGLIGERIDTTEGFAISAQEKTKQWAEVLRKSAGITPENQTFSDKLFEGAGSSATYFVPGLGISKGATVLSKVSPKIAMYFGGSASAGLEAMAEAGSTFDEVKKKDGLDKAAEASTKVFLANAILLSVTNQLGVFNPAKLGALKKALISAPIEGLQEASQQMIQNQATGRPIGEGVLEAGAIGAIVGSVMGGITDIASAPKTSQFPTTSKAGLYGAFKDAQEKAIEATKGLAQEGVVSTARSIADAIKQVESGGNYDARGKSGEIGAYQFMPATWSQWAKKWLGNANAPQTKENQDKVAEMQIQSLLDQGKTPREIALIWNGGQPVEKKGVNKFGVAYDSGAYADKVIAQLGTSATVAPSELSAIELQKQIEESGQVPSPTATEGQKQPNQAIPEGKGSALEVSIKLPETPQTPQKEKAYENLVRLSEKVKSFEDYKKAISKSDIENLDEVVQFHGTQIKELKDALEKGTVRVSETGVAGKGFYVTNTPETAEYFGKQVREGNARVQVATPPDVYAIDLRDLNIKKLPFGKQEYYDFLEKEKMTPDQYNESLQLQGFDGLNLVDRGETVIFDPKKVKTMNLDSLVKKPKVSELKQEIEKEKESKKKKTSEATVQKEGNKVPETKQEKQSKEKVESKKEVAPEKKVEEKKPVLQIEAQDAPKEGESRTQTEVQGQKVNRFTGQPQEQEKPRVIGREKPLFTKTSLKILLANNAEFKKNPVLTVEGEGDSKVLAWKGEKSQFQIKPSALGLVSENLQVGDQIRVTKEALEKSGQELRVIKYDEITGSGSRYASVGRYRDDTEIVFRNPETLKPIQFPELVAIAKEISGNVPFLKKYKLSNGMFYAKGDGEIGLNPDLFKRENLRQLQATLAHEIGHLIDYLPDHTVSRGNLMGRLNTLTDFRKDFFAEAGASRTDSEVREQMYELSKYWRPYDETTASESFKSYRKSAPEVYADFISALFNDPRLVSEKAPTAYNIFFEQLDAKPKVKTAYFELQNLLRTGDIIAKRRSAVPEMFKVTEQEARERQIQEQVEQEQKKKSIWFEFKHQSVDITESIREKVKQVQEAGGVINDDDNPNFYLEERNYLGGKIKAEVESKFNSIYQELQQEGMSWEELGELMFYERILKGDRQEVANPLGYQPDFVQELMEVYEDVGTVKPDEEAHRKGTSDMKTTLGEEKFNKLQELAKKYRENLKGFFKEGYTEGIYSDDLNQLFKENDFYVPFKGAKYSGTTRTTFGVKQMKGTLGNIENPANTGIEKAVSIIRAIERNKVTRKTIEFLEQNFSSEITVAPTDKNGYPIEPKEKDLALVTYMQDGKVKGYYVDKYIGEAIKKNTVAEMNQLITGLRFMNSKFFRPLFITFNLGFQTFNLIRDMKRFWKNVPNMTILKTMRLYSQATRASKIRAFGLPNNPSAQDIEAFNLINRLENEQLLSITYNDIIKGEAIEDAQIDRILREVGVRETEVTKLGALGDKFGITKKTPIIKQAFQILDFIEKTGNMIETLPKVAGVFALEDKMPPREMRSFVRRYVGSPDFMAGGKFKPYMNEVFLFSNAIFQGIRSDYEIATQPKTRSAYWFKTAQSEIVPKLLMLMATAGLLGEGLKEMFAKIGEYDKTNYTVVPLGIDENGKAVYFRMPSDETGRLIGGVFWKLAGALSEPEKLAELSTYGDLLTYAGGQVPSVTPTATTAFNITQFLAGQNPYDFFRNRPVLSKEQMDAGGMEKTKPFLTYLFQQMGGGIVMKLYTNETVPKDPSLSEKIASLPVVGNIAGRFIKASNYGEVESIREISNEVRSNKARENLANRRVVFDYVDQAQGKSDGEARAIKRDMIKQIYGGFPNTPEERTQARNLEKRFDTLRIRGTADARVDSLITATSNEEKVALLLEYKKTMPAEDYAELKKFIIKNRVVSSAVFQELYRVEK